MSRLFVLRILSLASLVVATSCGVKGPPEPPLPSEGSLTKTNIQNPPSGVTPDTASAPGDGTSGKPSSSPAGDFKDGKKSAKKKAQNKNIQKKETQKNEPQKSEQAE